MSGLHIMGVKVENMLRVELAEFEPSGNTIIITGGNAAGKSSLYDSMAFALGGEALIPKQPIRDGQDEGEVTVDIGEFIVKRRFVRTDKNKDGYNSYLSVTSKEGGKFSSGQTVLNAVLGKLMFDPLAFAEAPPKEQLKTLQVLVPLSIDLTAWQFAYDGAYQARRDAGRDADRLKAAFAEMRKPSATVFIDPEPIKAKKTEQQEKAQAAKEAWQEVDNQQFLISRQESSIVTRREEIQELEKQLAARKNLLAIELSGLDEAKKKLAEYEDRLESFNGVVDTTDYDAELQAIYASNAQLGAVDTYNKLRDQATQAVAVYQSYDDKVAELLATRDAAIKAAKFPVPGLAFGENGVIYQNLPFEQASQAEKIDVSVAIGMAANPKLRELFVRQGSLLDPQTRARIEKRAVENDYHVWYEIVDTSGQVGFYMEEGRLKAVDGQPVGAPAQPSVVKPQAVATAQEPEAEDAGAGVNPSSGPAGGAPLPAAPAVSSASDEAAPAPTPAPRKKSAGPPKRAAKPQITGDLLANAGPEKHNDVD